MVYACLVGVVCSPQTCRDESDLDFASQAGRILQDVLK
jgi:hypothetical protein